MSTHDFYSFVTNLTMRTYYLSTLLALTSTVGIYAPLPVQAQSTTCNPLPPGSTPTINVRDPDATSYFPNLPVQPIDSEYRLQTTGNPSIAAPFGNQGFAAFSNRAAQAPDSGHCDISRNAGGFGAPYYVTARPGSPEFPPSGATRATTVTEVIGFPTLSSYLSDNEISPTSIGFNFTQKSDRSFTDTWNLGDDVLGEDWFATPDSTLEERIYGADPDDVQLSLSYGTIPIIDLGYTPLYSTLDYGSTKEVKDDFEVNFTAPTVPTKVSGLDPSVDALADALLADVADAGGSLQVVLATTLIIDESRPNTGNGFNTLLFSFPADIRAVETVPEPSSALGILALGALGAVSYLKKQKNKRRPLT